MDFEKELCNIAEMIEHGSELAPETIPIATETLDEIEQRYGADSASPLPFHNAYHSLDVTRRGVRMANLLYPHIRSLHRRKFYDLVLIDGASHDYEQDLGPEKNECASVEVAIQKIEKADGTLNTKVFKKRLRYGSLATAVKVEDDSKLIQVNLRTGAHDPIKFIMAFSDINGIAMEGDKRMWQDATNLYYEICSEPTHEGLYNFLANQESFLRQRLNDHRIKSDIEYYFPDDAEVVYQEMRREFHGNIIRAFNLASSLKKKPELRESIEHVVEKFRNKRLLASTIGKVVRRQAENS